ncbi:hypothetical protein [Streptomyces sp. TS71-3]|uniref:hypothetical protein n=1 Tax=Streptomyces sp. TS71-3 TaxID=2733862 RepID=UPI001B1EB1E4|nr:hypothetical protein [Streptomyces sp. TS71-3]GHJ34513.1 hypothetical protein Sm713_01220 [Streptomyces sp. TS71-3]
MLDIGYALSTRFPDPPAIDYRAADVKALRYDLFCGDVYLADTEADRELSTAWGWVPVLDFAWALCGIVEELGHDPRGGRGPVRAELDFTESTDRLRFERHTRWVSVVADWARPGTPELTVPYGELRRESRDFLHDLLADLVDLHEDLAENPNVWQLQARFPRIRR